MGLSLPVSSHIQILNKYWDPCSICAPEVLVHPEILVTSLNEFYSWFEY